MEITPGSAWSSKEERVVISGAASYRPEALPVANQQC